MSTRCLIVDDEPLAIEVIASYLERLAGFEIAGSCRNGVEAFTSLREYPVDLLFLDINMPELTGLELLRSLQDPPGVILTTAHREYALDGYELDVVDYLLKPISFDRFLQAIDKYRQRFPGETAETSSGATGTPEPGYIDVKADRMMHRIPLGDIIYVESMKDYLKILTPRKKYLTKLTLGSFLEKLPADRFLRIHRSYIIGLDHIKAFDATMIEIGDQQLPIGGYYKQHVMAVLGNDGS